MPAFDTPDKLFGKLLHLVEFKAEYEPDAVADTIATDLGLVQGDIQDAATALNTQSGAINTERGVITTGTGGITTENANFQTQITALQAYITANPGSATELDPIKAALDTIRANYVTHGTNIGNANTNLGTAKTAIDGIKTDLDTADDDLGDIITDYGGKPTDQDVCDVMDKVHADLLAAINLTRNVPHGRCVHKGWYYKSQDTGDSADATIKKLCPGCGARGYLLTGTSDTPTYTFPVTEEAADELDQA